MGGWHRASGGTSASQVAAPGDRTARILQRAMTCDAVTLFSVDLHGSTGVLVRRAGITTVVPLDPSLTLSLVAAARRADAVVVAWPGPDGTPGTHLAVPVLAAQGRLDAWLLTRSADGFDALDLAHAGVLAAGLAQRSAGVHAREPVEQATMLTAREAQVLGLVESGLTASAIGRRLRISERTVQKHLEHVYGKLGCADRLSAVLRARATGLLPASAGAVAV